MLTCEASDKWSSNEQFISIDGRPLRQDAKLLKDFNTMYKKYLHDAVPDASVPRKPFVVLQLMCPRGSYDVNIEPTKGEVMFEDERHLLSLFEEVCDATYKGIGQVETSTISTTRMRPLEDSGIITAENALHPVRITNGTTSGTTSGITSDVEEVAATYSVDSKQQSQNLHPPKTGENDRELNVTIPIAARNMYDAVNQEVLDMARVTDVRGDETSTIAEDDDVSNIQVNNPFVLAKLNTRIAPTRSPPLSGTASTENVSNVYQGAGGQVVPAEVNDGTASSSPSDTESVVNPESECNNSYQNPGPPNRPWKPAGTALHSIREPALSRDLPGDGKNPDTGLPTLLDSWTARIQRSPCLSKRPPTTRTVDSSPSSTALNGRQMDLNSSRTSKLDPFERKAFRTPFKKKPSVDSTSNNANINAYITPISDKRSSLGRGQQLGHTGSQNIDPVTSDASQLVDIMDFESRKRESILQHRKSIRKSPGSSVQKAQDSCPAVVVVSNQQFELRSPSPDSSSDITLYAERFRSDNDIRNKAPASDAQAIPTSRDIRIAQEYMPEIAAASTNTNESSPTQISSTSTLRNVVDGQVSDTTLFRTTLNPNDPRAYLIRHGKSQNQEYTKESKHIVLSKLPFEKIPKLYTTFDVHAIMKATRDINILSISGKAQALLSTDIYIRKGIVEPALSGKSVSKELLIAWEASVMRMCRDRMSLIDPDTENE